MEITKALRVYDKCNELCNEHYINMQIKVYQGSINDQTITIRHVEDFGEIRLTSTLSDFMRYIH